MKIEQLTEAVNYDQMFSDDFITIMSYAYHGKTDDMLQKILKYNIKEVKQTLKKNDRIVWALRANKLFVIRGALYNYNVNNDELLELINSELLKYNKKAKTKISLNYIKHGLPNIGFSEFLVKLEHFLSLPIPKIQNYVFGWELPDEILELFEELEDEWKAKIKELIPDKGEKVFLKYDEVYTWFDLERAYCGDESEAMGHCGNQPARGDTNQTILSLRQKVVVDKEVYWRPVLTFIYHKSEMSLGEMKGRGNKKPAEKYHPQIIKLLKDERIRSIHGGGYLPENNFSLMDLDEAEREDLINNEHIDKESLPILTLYDMGEDIIDLIKERGSRYNFDLDSDDEYVIDDYADIGYFFEEHESRSEDTYHHLRDYVVDDDNAKDFVEEEIDVNKETLFNDMNDTFKYKMLKKYVEKQPFFSGFEPTPDEFVRSYLDDTTIQYLIDMKYSYYITGFQSALRDYLETIVIEGEYFDIDNTSTYGYMKFDDNNDVLESGCSFVIDKYSIREVIDGYFYDGEGSTDDDFFRYLIEYVSMDITLNTPDKSLEDFLYIYDRNAYEGELEDYIDRKYIP